MQLFSMCNVVHSLLQLRRKNPPKKMVLDGLVAKFGDTVAAKV